MSSPVSTTNTAPENRAPFLTVKQPLHLGEQIIRNQVRMSEEAIRQLLTARNELRFGEINIERLMKTILLAVAAAEITLNTSLEQLQLAERSRGKRNPKGCAPRLRQINAGNVVKTNGTEGRP